MSQVRVLHAEDHTLMRAGMRALLKDLPNIEIVGEAADGREALRMTEELHPDVVLMDISMAGMNGLEATSRISKEFAATKVIILSMHANEEYVLRALRAGASGYLPKDAAASELEIAIHAVARGETYLSPAVSKHVVGDYLRRVADERSPLEQLTPRQRETLQLIAEGQTTKEIAQTLQVSVKTVETHRAQLMERLDIHDIAGLVRYAMQMGLVRSER